MRHLKHVAFAVPVVLLFAIAFFASPSSSVGATMADGKAAFESAKCNMCHAVPSAGIEAKVKSEKMKGPDMVGQLQDASAEDLMKYLRKEGQFNGKDHKKGFTGSDEDLRAIVGWLQQLKAE